MDAIRRTQWLATGVLVLTAAALLGLLGRVAWIEKRMTPALGLAERVSRQSMAVSPIMPESGAIHLRDGTPAAMSVRKYNLFADPGYIVDPSGELNALKD